MIEEREISNVVLMIMKTHRKMNTKNNENKVRKKQENKIVEPS